MILALNITSENTLLQLFSKIDLLLKDFNLEESFGDGRGRPQIYSDVQIMKCLVYQAFHRIVSFRELEWKLYHDPTCYSGLVLICIMDTLLQKSLRVMIM